MPDTPVSTPTPTTDPEVAALKAELERLKARTDVMTSVQSALTSLAPKVTDAPKGEVSLGDKAGSLAPWLANAMLSGAAETIVQRVNQALRGGESTAGAGRRVLVTEDQSLLQTDVTTRSIQWTLASRSADLQAELALVTTATSQLNDALTPVDASELEKLLNPSLDLGRVNLLDASAGATKDTSGDSSGAGAAAGGGASQPDTSAGGAASGAATAAPIGAALDLVNLTRTDYTLTAAEVTIPNSLLAVLTAGLLSRPSAGQPSAGEVDVEVLVDGLGVVRDDSPTWVQVKALAAAVDSLTQATRALRTTLSPLSAEVEFVKAEVDDLDKAWQAILGNKDAPSGADDKMKADLDARRTHLSDRSAIEAPAASAADHAEALLASVTADLTALVTADAAGVTPLQRACSREGLHDTGRPITHVLHVSVAHAGADVVTRRSILGSSGRVGYLSGVAVAWALIETETGRIIAGGPEHCAGELVHDLTTGRTVSGRLETDLGRAVNLETALGKDPAMTQENALRWAVMLVAGAIALLAVVSVIRLFIR